MVPEGGVIERGRYSSITLINMKRHLKEKKTLLLAHLAGRSLFWAILWTLKVVFCSKYYIPTRIRCFRKKVCICCFSFHISKQNLLSCPGQNEVGHWLLLSQMFDLSNAESFCFIWQKRGNLAEIVLDQKSF